MHKKGVRLHDTSRKIDEFDSSGRRTDRRIQKINYGHTKDVYETVCSFSNRDGGHIFLGVKDNGTILGVDKGCVEQMKTDL